MKKILLSCLVGMLGACGGDSSDPDTLNPEDLSPPLDLKTVTGDAKVELRWQANNFEDDLKGYHVFVTGADKGISDVSANAKYPTGVDISAGQTLPFCLDNAALFKMFGITAEVTNDCEGAKSTPATGLALQDDATTLGVAQASVTCYDPATPTTSLGEVNADDATATLSLKKDATAGSYRSGIGTHRCLVTKDSAGEALVNGKTYTFFVVAVTGDDYSGISWTSNFVDDTPAVAVVDNKTVSLAYRTYVSFSFDTTDIDKVIDTTALTATTCPTTKSDGSSSSSHKDICSVYGITPSTSTAGIYLGRDSFSSSFPQRLFISAPKDGEIKILHRGDRMTDPIKTTIEARIPGDEAVAVASDSSIYRSTGRSWIVRDRQVYDFVLTRSSVNYYGKIAFGDITYATATDKTSSANIPVTIVLQSKAATTHYLR